MVSNINQVVDVQISRETLTIDQANFNTLLFITNEQVFTERSRKYYDQAQLIADGFDENGPAYRAATAFFSQSPRPVQITIGIRKGAVQVLELADSDIKNFTTYSVTATDVNGASETVSFTTDGTAENDLAVARTAIVDALVAAAGASVPFSAIVTLTEPTADQITVTKVDPAATYSYENLSISTSLGTYEDWSDTFAAQNAYDCEWYSVAAYTHVEADVLSIAGIVETDYKIYLTSTQHAANLVAIPAGQTAAANDLFGKLNELNYDRTAIFYNSYADSRYIEAAVAGKKLTTIAGSTTWMFTVLSGQTADNLTASESQILRDKQGNTYESIAGVNMIREGVLSSGEYIDIIRGSDELRNRIQVEVLRALVVTANGGSKVPLTDEGVADLIAIVRGELRRSAENGFLQQFVAVDDGSGGTKIIEGYVVESSLVSSLPANLRALRQAPDIRFAASPQSAIHKAIIRGVISV